MTAAPVAMLVQGGDDFSGGSAGLLYKRFCRDLQTLPAGFSTTAGGDGGTVDFRNGYLRFDPAMDGAGCVGVVSDAAPLVNNFVVEWRRWTRSPDYHGVSVGAGDFAANNDDDASWWLGGLLSGYQTTHFNVGGSWSLTQARIREAPPSGSWTLVDNGGATEPDRYWQTGRLSYYGSGSIAYTLDGAAQASGTDTTWNANSKKLAVTQGEYDGETAANGGTQYVDWFFARPFYNTDPTITVGAQVAV